MQLALLPAMALRLHELISSFPPHHALNCMSLQTPIMSHVITPHSCLLPEIVVASSLFDCRLLVLGNAPDNATTAWLMSVSSN